MAEVGSGPEYFPTILPEYIGAVFKQGRYGPYVERRAVVVPDYDVLKEEERNSWLFENLNVFTDGTTPSPELRWKRTADDWLADIKIAARRGKLDRKTEQGVESDIKAMMAVSASARAMEQSGGSAEKYGIFITLSEKPDLDKQDAWSDFLLHNDSEKLNRVIDNPLVRHYYDRLLEHAGIDPNNHDLSDLSKSGVQEWKGKAKSQIKVDVEKARGTKDKKGKLVEYLENSAKKGGFDSYIAEVLLEADKVKEGQDDLKQEFVDEMLAKKIVLSDPVRWAAAKLACDAFIVDKFTRWDYLVTDKGRAREPRQLYPTPNWGGDPLRAVLEPSFLPKRIKGVYHGEDEEVLKAIDEAFRPGDIFVDEYDNNYTKDENEIRHPKLTTDQDAALQKILLPASMVGHLKDYYRYSNALATVIGSSRADAIPVWNEKTMGEELMSTANLLDQVYGIKESEVKIKLEGGNLTPQVGTVAMENEILSPIGKHVVGAMVARILYAKALALSAESQKPGFRENFRYFLVTEDRPFDKIQKFLLGQDEQGKEGFLASLGAGRTRFVFNGNKFGAQGFVKKTWQILETNDQNKEAWGSAERKQKIRAILSGLKAFSGSR